MFINYRSDNGQRQCNRDPNAGNTILPILSPVIDGRLLRPAPRLDTHGFELLLFGTHLALGPGLPEKQDYLVEDMVKQILYPWCEEVVKQATGAACVQCFHHLVRGKSTSEKFAALAHCDYSTKTAYDLFNGLSGSIEFKKFRGRYAVFNLWKNINPNQPILNHHLAMCDGRTVAAPDDFLLWENYDTPSSTTPHHVFHMTPNNHRRHQWCYFPRMSFNEAILFVQYDSDYAKKCRYTFHSSVSDAQYPSDFNRESIEIRLAAWFPDPNNNTVPDFTIRPELRVAAACTTIRSDLNSWKSWGAEGQSWVAAAVLSGNFSGVIRGMCQHGRENGNRAEYKDLTDAEVVLVVHALLAQNFAQELSTITNLKPEVSTNPQTVRAASNAVTDILKNSPHWDQRGKEWLGQCVRRDDIEAVVRGVCEHQRKEGTKKEFSALTNGDINAVVRTLMSDQSFAAMVRQKAPKV